MKKRKRNGAVAFRQQLIVMIVVLLLMLIALAAAFVAFYKPPVKTEVPFSTDTGVADGTDNPENPGNPSDTTADAGNTETPDIPQYVARDEVYNFLIVGHDRVATLADVIMLVNYDVQAGKVAIMQLPRDTYFEGDSSVPQLNVQFSAFYNRALFAGDRNPAKTAVQKFAEVLEQNLCINIHYTAVMNLDGFADIVNAIGGVDMDIPYDMDYEDPEQDLYIHFKKGAAHLNGADAEKFVRFRDTLVQADIGRGNAQKLFMTAFIEKCMNTISITDVSLLNSLAQAVVDNLTTDLTVADVVYFAKNVLKVDMSAITMMTIPGGSASHYYVINRGATLQTINSHFNVYDSEIIAEIFDQGVVFADDSSTSSIYKAYYAANAEISTEYTAEDIRDDSIYIPIKPKEPVKTEETTAPAASTESDAPADTETPAETETLPESNDENETGEE